MTLRERFEFVDAAWLTVAIAIAIVVIVMLVAGTVERRLSR